MGYPYPFFKLAVVEACKNHLQDIKAFAQGMQVACHGQKKDWEKFMATEIKADPVVLDEIPKELQPFVRE